MSIFDYDNDSEEFSTVMYYVSSFLLNYGWYFVGLGIFYLVYRDKINKFFDKWYEQREDSAYLAKYHKNPDLAINRMEAVQKARQKMQEELNEKAVQAAIRKKELEEKKLQEKLEKYSKDDGRKLGEASTSKNTLRSEYNPLMNDSGGRYRAPKRSCCNKGGGCG